MISSFSDASKQWLERRFLASNPISVVFDYLTVEGYPSEEFKVLSSWPRRDVSFKWHVFINTVGIRIPGPFDF
jgi:hypothetical protein